jgi:hypothetical protein
MLVVSAKKDAGNMILGGYQICSRLAGGAIMVCAAFLIPPGEAAPTLTRQMLPGHVPAAVASCSPLGPMAADCRLHLAIGLPLRNREALTNLLQQLYDPVNPLFHHYLNAAEFAEAFGPSMNDYQALIDFASSNRMTVTATHPNRTLLDVSATVADIEKAFKINMRLYQHPTENRTFFSPDVEPSMYLPHIFIQAVSGLNNFVLPRPMNLKMAESSKSGRSAPLSGSGTNGTYIGTDFRAAYVPGVTLTGAGQTVGLLQFDGYFSNDIVAYENLAGMRSVPLVNVLLDDYDGTPGGNDDEVSLDIELVISIAPGLSKIIVYEAGPYGIGNDILNRMATDNLAAQLSSSWTFSTDNNTPAIFQQFAAQGQSYFNASGDADAYIGWIPTPAGDPNITIVGGTTLSTTGPAGGYVAEAAWNRNNNIGTSGGITSYPIPSWQMGIDMMACNGSDVLRNIPDVALTAENVWVIYNNGHGGAYGGTSCATPLWAGFTALVNQQAAANTEPPVGFINPAVYAIGQGSNYAAAFHDTTAGSNTNSSSPTNFPAVAGYDLCTGWGTPRGQGLIDALAPADSLIIFPTSGFNSTGAVTGPFTVTSQIISLSNSGAIPLNWSLGTTSVWLGASLNGGTIPPHSGITLTAGLSTASTNLPLGNYTAKIWFTNLTSGILHQLAYDLQAADPLAFVPTVGFGSLGVAGGPFSIVSQDYSLTNLSLSSLDWSLGNTCVWLTSSIAKGTLPSGSSTVMTVSLNSNATNLPPGAYAATLEISNLTSEVVATLAFNLQVRDPLTITPGSSFSASGPAGGPFSVTSQTYSLSNSSALPLNWAVANGAAWLTISPGGGTIPAGSTGTAVIGLNSTASNLLSGLYAANVVFSNVDFHAVQSRQFALAVGGLAVQNGGFEAGNFSGWTQSGNTAYTTVQSDPTYVHSGNYGAVLGPSGTPGYISQSLATVPGQAYVVSLWLKAPAGGAPTEFLASWNGTNVYDRFNLPAIGWTNIRVPVVSTRANTILQFGFRNDPDFFGLDDISVQPVPPPMIQTVTAGNGSLTLVWSAVAGGQYQVQYKADLTQTNWTALGVPITASNSMAFASDPISPAAPQRFYRILVMP